MLGFLTLGPKISEAPYSPADMRLLQSVASQTGFAIENSRLSSAIALETAQREVLNRELAIAREVQERLFPQECPSVRLFHIAAGCPSPRYRRRLRQRRAGVVADGQRQFPCVRGLIRESLCHFFLCPVRARSTPVDVRQCRPQSAHPIAPQCRCGKARSRRAAGRALVPRNRPASRPHCFEPPMNSPARPLSTTT